jgi:hypothetical protein
MNDDMIQFYHKIRHQTQTKKLDDRIGENIKSVADLIMTSFRDQVKLAAQNGHTYAYIFIYDKRAVFKGIPINKYMFPDEDLIEKTKSRKLASVRELVNSKIFPFVAIYNEIKIGEVIYVTLAVQWSDI